MNFQEQIKRIRTKLEKLKTKDKNFQCFGAQKHQYKLNPTKTEEEIQIFEKNYNTKLPSQYKTFLKNIGNGGAGPYYGLEKLENGLYADLDRKEENDKVDISKPFPFSKKWNLIESALGEKVSIEEYNKVENEYFENKWVNGLLRISNFGCGVYINLVVTGKESGNIWIDDRANDGGLYPDPYFGQTERTTFLNWYELWLNKELEKQL